MAVAESLGAEQLAVAGSAVDLLVGAIAGQHRVQRTMALSAVEALFVPHLNKTYLLLLVTYTYIIFLKYYNTLHNKLLYKSINVYDSVLFMSYLKFILFYKFLF